MVSVYRPSLSEPKSVNAPLKLNSTQVVGPPTMYSGNKSTYWPSLCRCNLNALGKTESCESKLIVMLVTRERCTAPLLITTDNTRGDCASYAPMSGALP